MKASKIYFENFHHNNFFFDDPKDKESEDSPGTVDPGDDPDE